MTNTQQLHKKWAAEEVAPCDFNEIYTAAVCDTLGSKCVSPVLFLSKEVVSAVCQQLKV